MYFEIIGPITDVDTIAAGRSIRQLSRLRRQHGQGRWRKLKGIATVRIASGDLRRAEIHWYEAHGNRTRSPQDQEVLRLSHADT
jgi:hypothetical protein